MPFFDEVLADFHKIIDFAIEDNNAGAVLICDGLLFSGALKDGETLVPEGDVAFDVVSFFIEIAMMEELIDRPDFIGRCQFAFVIQDNTAKTAHTDHFIYSKQKFGIA